MQTQSVRHTRLSAVLLVCLAALLVNVACAAPPPPRMDTYTAVESDGPRGYFLPYDSSLETVQATLDDIYSGGEWQGQSIGNLPEILGNYNNGRPLTTDAALQWPVGYEISEEALIEGLTPHLLGKPGVTCVESGNQAFWIIDTATLGSLLDELDPGSEAYASLLSCGDVADCEECGCIGPMEGPTCSASLQPIIPLFYPSGN